MTLRSYSLASIAAQCSSSAAPRIALSIRSQPSSGLRFAWHSPRLVEYPSVTSVLFTHRSERWRSEAHLELTIVLGLPVDLAARSRSKSCAGSIPVASTPLLLTRPCTRGAVAHFRGDVTRLSRPSVPPTMNRGERGPCVGGRGGECQAAGGRARSRRWRIPGEKGHSPRRRT